MDLLKRIEKLKAKQEKKKPKREPGAWVGNKLRISDDFDAQLTLGEKFEAGQLTLAAAQDAVLRGREKGMTCPCCGQFVKLYRRKMTSDMARFVCILSKYKPGRWVNIKKIDVRGGDYAKVVHWGLAEQRENDDETKKNSNIWRLTPLGYAFARGEKKLLSHVFLYNGQCEGFMGTKIDVRDALGEKFDYGELMEFRRSKP